MQALWLENQQLTYRTDIPMPTLAPQEALVKVRLAGICATDLQLLKGYYPFNGILGHEFVGEIVEAPAATQRVGERVVGEINVACGQCSACQALRSNHCQQRTVLGIHGRHGAFAEYLALPLTNLHHVPANISDELAVFTEPVAAALQIQQQRWIRPTDKGLIIGAGRLGQLIAQTLALTGCHLKVVARYPKQQHLLATRGIESLAETAVETSGYDWVVEATGSTAGFSLAQQAVRPGGTIILKSTYKGELSLDMSRLVVDEITVFGSRCGPFPAALQLFSKNLIDPTLLIENILPLSQGLQAFEQLKKEKGILKILLR